jgi:hypothetical protein
MCQSVRILYINLTDISIGPYDRREVTKGGTQIPRWHCIIEEQMAAVTTPGNSGNVILRSDICWPKAAL